ncbi:hypothetical protein N7457_000473 [Penicillium paradoxum]|uniref:uncharacterized protein n=1 Tax=Penicillium paradoxum TaxID=176176 RepID=UPI002547D208|nr:uncharacterized protein N7457_000473 [Penicillium paradoxum]KAJ5793874.1 hypothetical protein N7457_000473 [Penicillium paradoxum]
MRSTLLFSSLAASACANVFGTVYVTEWTTTTVTKTFTEWPSLKTNGPVNKGTASILNSAVKEETDSPVLTSPIVEVAADSDSTSSVAEVAANSVSTSSVVEATSSVAATSSVEAISSAAATSSVEAISSVAATSSVEAISSAAAASSVEAISSAAATSSIEATSSVAATSSVEAASSPAETSAVQSTSAVTSSASSTVSASAAPSASVAASSGATNSYEEMVIFNHNIHRANHSSPDLTWSPKLAASAQTLASRCVFAHDVSIDGGGYGQNLASGIAAEYVGAAISSAFYNNEAPRFADEYGKANPDTSYMTWGHFSQVVWKSTTEVGCATAECSGQAPITVCNYSPPGNYGGMYAENVLAPKGDAPYQFQA